MSVKEDVSKVVDDATRRPLLIDEIVDAMVKRRQLNEAPVLAVITGDVGSGKTSMMAQLRMALEERCKMPGVACFDDVYPSDAYEVLCRLENMRLHPEEITFDIAGLGLFEAARFGRPVKELLPAFVIVVLACPYESLDARTRDRMMADAAVTVSMRSGAAYPHIKPFDSLGSLASTFVSEIDRCHHLSESIDDALADCGEATEGERFVVALGETLRLLGELYDSGVLSEEWPSVDRAINAMLSLSASGC